MMRLWLGRLSRLLIEPGFLFKVLVMIICLIAALYLKPIPASTACGGDLDCYEKCRDGGKSDKQCHGYGYKDWFRGKWETGHGWTTEYGDWIPFACERTWANDDELENGVQRFLLHTGPDHKTVCNTIGYGDCYENSDKSPNALKWRQPMVVIDYRKQHEVCVDNMYNDKRRVCFDLYELGER